MTTATPREALIGKFTHRTFDCRICGEPHLNRQPLGITGMPWEPGAYVVANESGDVAWAPAHPENIAVAAVLEREVATAAAPQNGTGNGAPSPEVRGGILDAAREIVAAHVAEHHAEADRAPLPQPSARAQAMLGKVREAAEVEVAAHLAAGRPVHGVRDGKPVTIEPLPQQTPIPSAVAPVDAADGFANRVAPSGGDSEPRKGSEQSVRSDLVWSGGRVHLRACGTEYRGCAPDCPAAASDASAAPDPEPPKRANYIGAPHFFELNNACRVLVDAFGYHIYLVGSALDRRDYRDVDVRAILPDEEYARLFPGLSGNPSLNAMWSLLCSSISLWLAQRTGLPIDFQIQQQTEANAANAHRRGKRHPLGMFLEPKP